METGTKILAQFIEDFAKDSSRFSWLMWRQNNENFPIIADRFKVSGASNKKPLTVTMTRDVSESVLFHALLAKVNTGKELWYPLTSASLLLCHPDRTIQNTPKFKQLLEPEKQINSCSPGTINVRTVNGIFFAFFFFFFFWLATHIWSFGKVNLTTNLQTKRYGNPSFIWQNI